MNILHVRIGYLGELIFNTIFILIYFFSKIGKLPSSFLTGEYSSIYRIMTYAAPFFVLLTLYTHFKRSRDVEEFIRKYIFSLIIFIPLLITLGDTEFTYWLSIVHLFSTFLSLSDFKKKSPSDALITKSLSISLIDQFKLNPAQIVIMSFAVIIFIGTLLLVLPIAANPGRSIGFVDALFMSTSATCVTGLATISMVDDLSTFGQLVLLFLLQVGGLGIMTLSSGAAMFMGRSLGVRDQVLMQDVLDSKTGEELTQLIIDIAKFTFFIELIGALILTWGFYENDFEFGQALYYGIYHSVSAFCNAGLALFNNNLEDFKFNSTISLTISFLIIFGGIGFNVIQEVYNGIRLRKNWRDYSTHTKIVVVTTFFLLSIGTIYLFFSEFLHAFQEMGIWDKFLVSFFQSTTTRTAGFNTINLNNLHSHAIYLMIMLMFIGAAPGSTGGGIKVTTFAILVQSVKSTLKNENRVEFFERTIPADTVVKSISITIISFMTVSIGLLMMMRFEPGKDFLAVLFEVVSAFGTVGLSLGITPMLTALGKLTLVVLMFIGRVGALTLVVAVAQRGFQKSGFTYPETKVLIG